VLGFVCVAFGIGCSSSGKTAKVTVSGKVTLKGQPVQGEVIFIGPDNKEIKGVLHGTDGTYSIPNPPPGTYKVAVKGLLGATPGGPQMTGPGMEGMKPPTGPPARYASPDNGLKYEVTDAKTQTFDIELKE